MALITRCPACGTMFRVVSDQLKVSGGWVRCGQCAEIFDAQLYWQKNTDLIVPQVSQATTFLGVAVPDQTTDDSTSFFAAQDLPTDPKVGEVATLEPESFSSSTPEPIQLIKPGIENQDATLVGEPGLELPAGEVSEAVFKDMSFIRNARRQAFWRNPMLRAILALFVLILAGLFAVQLAVHQQSALLAFEPGLKPWLQQLCRPFACDIGLSKRIDAIVIDSSSFNKSSEAGGFRLGFVLKNTGNIEVAMPSLEISLTDTQEQVVVRRVLFPAQFGATNGLLAANSDFANALTLQIQLDAPLQRIAGYRLLAFYP